jgi:N-hydroxyarylamine O-acetyltransferase
VPESPLDLDAYLRRIGHSGPLEPSAEVLSALHEAHVGAIPFENLDVLLGRPIALELEALQAKMVAGGRGGYCFEHNTLFRGALERLGFRVTSLAARVRVGATDIRPRTHMLLLVDLAAGQVLADVGFGGEGPVHPLPLATDRQVGEGGFGHRLRREDGWWVLQGNDTGDWIDLYAFTLEPHYPVDFEMANHFTSTYPNSPFRRNLTAQLSRPRGRVILRNRDLVLRSGGSARSETIRDPEHLLEALDHHFGLSFPKGTRFPYPAF